MSQAATQHRTEARELGQRLAAALEKLVFASALYRLSLAGGSDEALLASPPTRAGDARRGAAILTGEWHLAGERVPAEDPFAPTISEEASAELHGFRWLADLEAAASDAARERACELIARWIEHHGEWSPLAWRGDVLGRRVGAWLAEYPFFSAGSDDVFRAPFFRSLARQLRHLERLARLGGDALGPAGNGRLEALVAFVSAAASLPSWRARLSRSLVLLLHEVARQVLPDGGHYQRSPAVHLEVLEALVGVRVMLVAGRLSVPTALQSAIGGMASMLRFFRHGDGGLALFNHSDEGNAVEIDDLLALTDAPGEPPSGAPDTGFQRLEAGRALVLLDAGTPPAAASDVYAHAGTLSFELSHGKERVVVNCGARPHAKAAWLAAQRATAAHSTLVLANANSSEILPSGRLGRRPRHVLCRREEADGAILVDASHDGYAPAMGVLHRRRLYLAADGEDLRGEDRLARVRPSGDPLAFAIRFHLHPDVQVSLLHDGSAALLRTASGAGFRLDAAGGRLMLEESIYLGSPAGVRRSEQIVIESTLAGEEALVKWSLKRFGG